MMGQPSTHLILFIKVDHFTQCSFGCNNKHCRFIENQLVERRVALWECWEVLSYKAFKLLEPPIMYRTNYYY
ncbi:unnamed protein product [Linum trigynum]|uniref:Uncharacterized protein n=1 Tax=Linum trigynum TaxID=586398 RepID=A0AAV2G9V1_9ROSI